MGTATTMAVALEALGMTLPSTALLPATSGARMAAGEATGTRAVELALDRTTPESIITLEALENAFRVVAAAGGSTNAVIHLEAIAGRAGIEIGLDRFGEWSRTTPLLADVRPSGRALLDDLEAAGGVPALMNELAPLLHLDCPAGNGRTWHEELDGEHARPREGAGLRPLDNPVWPSGALVSLRGTLAPNGAIIKRSAAERRLWRHTGPALIFEGVADLRSRIDDPDLDVSRDSVLVLRGVGPVGGPGMPEVGQLPIPGKLLQQGVTDMLRISDARMSGTGSGAVVLHVSPEAAVGGPLALAREGDLIALDVEAGRIDLLVSPRELASRTALPERTTSSERGFAWLYQRHILQADQGCDFDFLRPQAKAGRPPHAR
jgi:dihydroxy-acid dehydratase